MQQVQPIGGNGSNAVVGTGQLANDRCRGIGVITQIGGLQDCRRKTVGVLKTPKRCSSDWTQ